MDIQEYKGNKYLLHNNKLLTSLYSPDKEVERFLGSLNYSLKNSIYIIFGVGTGEYVRRLVSNMDSSNQIIIFEPIKAIFDAYQHSAIYIESDRIHYVVEDMNQVLSTLINKGLNSRFKVVYGYMNYRNCFKSEYLNFLKTIRNDSVNILTNEITIEFFSRQFTCNAIVNLYRNGFDLPVSRFKNQFSKVPALIVSGGPSLDKNQHLINEFKGIVISGGRTAKSFLNQNIKMDILVSVDPGKNAYTLIEDLPAHHDKIPLFTYVESNSEIIEAYKGPKVLMQSPWMVLKEKEFSEVDVIKTGPSIANVSFHLAEYLGCEPIIFIGQDLAFTDGKHHAENAAARFDEESQIGKANIEIDGFFGEKVRTSNQFFSMLTSFQESIKRSATTFYNCTEGGAWIEGCKHIAFEEYINSQEPESAYDIQERLSNLYDSDETLGTGKDLQELKRKTERVEKLTQGSLRILNELISKKNKQDIINRLLKKMNDQDDKILNTIKNDSILNYLFGDAKIQYENSRRIAEKTHEMSIYKSNLKFYKDLNKKFQFLDNFVKELLNE